MNAMMGFAKTLFSETYRSSPWKKRNDSTLNTWPQFEAFFQQNQISYIDYILTHRLLKLTHRLLKTEHPSSQEAAFFVCHLIRSAREGHLCIKINDDHLIPESSHVWQNEESQPLSFEESKILNDWIIKGSQLIPSQLISELSDIDESEKLISTPLCRYQNYFYLQRHWVFETLLIKQIKNLSSISPRINLVSEDIMKSVDDALKNGLLLPEQAEAIISGCLNSISIITGGPGTGKTYTAGQLIKIFWENLSLEQKLHCTIAVAAPTGKAVANLQKNLSKVVSDLKDLPTITTKTLHSLLGIKSQASLNKVNTPKLPVDLLIVDESSMIDVRLMATLFEAIKLGSRVILLGDQHQLSSVDAGSVFADLVDLASNKDRFIIPCTYLKTCLRTELKSILDFAALVNAGKADEALEVMKTPSCSGIQRLPFDLDKSEAQKSFINYASASFPSLIRREMESDFLLNLFQSMRLLSPMRKGPFGVDTLNNLLWNHFSQTKEREGWLAIPIMIVTNDYRRDLFNGETGTLMRKLPLNNFHSEDYALFSPRTNEEGIRKIPAAMLSKYEYAYCLSVHKSQGSEFDRIILMMPEGSELFGREVFYTAITRARKQVDICGSDEVLHKTISQQGKRLSGIPQRLK